MLISSVINLCKWHQFLWKIQSRCANNRRPKNSRTQLLYRHPTISLRTGLRGPRRGGSKWFRNGRHADSAFAGPSTRVVAIRKATRCARFHPSLEGSRWDWDLSKDLGFANRAAAEWRKVQQESTGDAEVRSSWTAFVTAEKNVSLWGECMPGQYAKNSLFTKWRET